jgi:membrane protease YdiL (CAAX protease family)
MENWRVRKLEQHARALSPAAEFCIVVGVAFALPTASSLWVALGGLADAGPVQFTEDDLRFVVLEEAMLLLALGWFLRVRGWSVEHFAAYPSGRELAMAIGLAVASTTVWALPWVLFAPGDTGASSSGAGLSWPGILAVSIINPLFEELFLCAYMLPFLAKRRGPVVAVAASLLVRLSFHTYQGPVGLLSIGLVGLVFTIFYVRTQRLWPVLIAHGALDILALANG